MEIINHECYVSFDVAKLLKDAGFDWECSAFYGRVYYLKGTKNIVHPDSYSLGEMDIVLEDKLIFGNYKNCKDYNTGYAAPTLDVAQRWLREVKNLHIEVSPNSDMSAYIYNIPLSWDKFWLDSPTSYATYEEAKEAGIKKALEIILEEWE